MAKKQVSIRKSDTEIIELKHLKRISTVAQECGLTHQSIRDRIAVGKYKTIKIDKMTFIIEGDTPSE